MEFISQSPAETQRIAWQAIEKKAREPRAGALCIALAGELGAGKTTIIQGVGKKLAITQPMTSPTFLLMRELSLPCFWHGVEKVYHFDWYRLKNKNQVDALGWSAILKEASNFVLVEWADKFPALFLQGTLWLFLEYKKEGRIIRLVEA